jgi:hypothetical protein
MKGKVIILLFIAMIFFPYFHEFGHCIVSYAYGNEIIEIHYNHIVTSNYNLSLFENIIFKSAGLIITFYPPLFIFIFLWSKHSSYWVIPYTLMALSTSSSTRDFYDICLMLDMVNFYQYYNLFFICISLSMVFTLFYQVYKDDLNKRNLPALINT